MKHIILKNTLMKPTIWIGLGFIIGAFIVMIREPIPFPGFYWHIIGNFVMAMILTIPGALLIGLAIARTLESHNIVGLK